MEAIDISHALVANRAEPIDSEIPPRMAAIKNLRFIEAAYLK
jgi:hypothetical protein